MIVRCTTRLSNWWGVLKSKRESPSFICIVVELIFPWIYSLERMEVMERVAELFAGHHHLLSGFNQFLPTGYRLEPSENPSHSNKVDIITPEGRRSCRAPSEIAIGSRVHWTAPFFSSTFLYTAHENYINEPDISCWFPQKLYWIVGKSQSARITGVYFI